MAVSMCTFRFPLARRLQASSRRVRQDSRSRSRTCRATEIIDEMNPAGHVRPVIIQLAAASGAYIIVSSTGSTSYSALKSRREAMAEALQGSPEAANLTLDFYDRNRVATWLRHHPGLIPLV